MIGKNKGDARKEKKPSKSIFSSLFTKDKGDSVMDNASNDDASIPTQKYFSAIKKSNLSSGKQHQLGTLLTQLSSLGLTDMLFKGKTEPSHITELSETEISTLQTFCQIAERMQNMFSDSAKNGKCQFFTIEGFEQETRTLLGNNGDYTLSLKRRHSQKKTVQLISGDITILASEHSWQGAFESAIASLKKNFLKKNSDERTSRQ